MTAKKELFLDTKSNCFFCLNGVGSDDPVSPDAGNINAQINRTTEFCLRNICRHLKINPSLVLLKCLKGEHVEDDVASANCDFSVTLCTNCHSVADKLSSLLRELEVTKMLVDYQLQSLEQILTATSSRDETEKMIENVDKKTIEAQLVEALREETKQKCSKRVKTIRSYTRTPRVQISRLNIQRDFSLENTTQSSPPRKRHGSLREKVATTARTIAVAGSEQAKFNLDENQRLPSNHSDRNCCPFCSRTFFKPDSMQQHKIKDHPDQIFSLKSKLPQLPMEQFRACSLTVLQNEKDACRTTAQVKGYPIKHCSFCSASFRDIDDLQVHMCSRHLDILEEKLKLFQLNFQKIK